MKSSARASAGSDVDAFAGVRFTHPDKVLYPQSETTKRDIAEYYQIAQKWMLPHVVDRPLALVRSPAGVNGKQFFQRNWTSSLPSAVGKVDVSDSKKRDEHIAIDNFAGLISLVQMNVLEIHTWNCHREDIEHPDQLVFDLDPGPGVSWKQIIDAARAVKKLLDAIKLPTFLKTTGGKGLHIVIPIKPNVEWDTAKSFCQTIAKSLVESSDLFVANMRKDLRGGKVYVDYQRNGRFATAVAPYSTRARAGAPVSMPIAWEDLGKISSAAHFTVANAGKYLKKRKIDPWRGFQKSRADLRRRR